MCTLKYVFKTYGQNEKKKKFLVANDTACMFTNVDRLSYRRFFSAIKLFVVRWFYNKPKKQLL